MVKFILHSIFCLCLFNSCQTSAPIQIDELKNIAIHSVHPPFESGDTIFYQNQLGPCKVGEPQYPQNMVFSSKQLETYLLANTKADTIIFSNQPTDKLNKNTPHLTIHLNFSLVNNKTAELIESYFKNEKKQKFKKEFKYEKGKWNQKKTNRTELVTP